MGGCGEGSGALRDTALSLPQGSLAHPRPEGLEGPGEKATIDLSPHPLPQGPLGADCWRSRSSNHCAQGLVLMVSREWLRSRSPADNRAPAPPLLQEATLGGPARPDMKRGQLDRAVRSHSLMAPDFSCSDLQRILCFTCLVCGRGGNN